MNSPNYIKDGFLFFRAKNNFAPFLGDPLVIENYKRIDHIIDYTKKTGVKWIQIRDDSVKNLDFLVENPNIEGITILTSDVSLDGLEKLEKLRVLTFDKSTSILDLSMFNDLNILSYADNGKIKNLETCKSLKVLNIESYKKSNLEEFTSLELLERIFLTYSRNLTTLRGIERLKNLHSLKIHSASNLIDLNGLNQKNICLETFDIYSAKRLVDYTGISKLENLKNLYLSKTGDIQSLSFLKNLTNLQKVAFGSKVLDGDMSLLKKVPMVSFTNHTHYSHKHKGIGFSKLEE